LADVRLVVEVGSFTVDREPHDMLLSNVWSTAS